MILEAIILENYIRLCTFPLSYRKEERFQLKSPNRLNLNNQEQL